VKMRGNCSFCLILVELMTSVTTVNVYCD
jgi:hypothetical protein